MASRTSVNDFSSQVTAKSGKNTIVSSVKADNSAQISINGTVTHTKVFWMQNGGTVTDANPTGEQLVIIGADGTTIKADAQQFLNGLK